MKKIIGISGAKQVGKDTVADYLCIKFGYKKLAFGDFIKEEVKKILKSVGIEYREEEKEKFRFLLQSWGDFRRQEDAYYWIKKLFKKAERFSRLVISDCRFISEIEEVKKRGGLIFKITRKTKFKDEHISERDFHSYKNFDAVLKNNQTKKDLYKKIDELALKFKF